MAGLPRQQDVVAATACKESEPGHRRRVEPGSGGQARDNTCGPRGHKKWMEA